MARATAGAPALSIVIPAPADAEALEVTLVSVLENRPADCEVVVALGFRYDDPWRIADEVRMVAAPPGSGPVACTNLGVAASTAPIVHVLAAGWLATPGWTDGPLGMLADHDDVTAVVPLGVARDSCGTIVSAGVRTSRGGRRVAVVPSGGGQRPDLPDVTRIAPSAPVLEAGFWRAETLAAVGPGFAACCGDWLADADMAAALDSLPGRVVCAAESRVVCGPERRPPRAFAAGVQAERLFLRSLARGSLPTALVAHVVEVMRDAVTRAPLDVVPMLLGRLVAVLQFGEFVPRLMRLRSVRNRMAGRTLRTDAPHVIPARPRHRREVERPLRRSA